MIRKTENKEEDGRDGGRKSNEEVSREGRKYMKEGRQREGGIRY